MTASTKCCNVKIVLAMWASSTDAQVYEKQIVTNHNTTKRYHLFRSVTLAMHVAHSYRRSLEQHVGFWHFGIHSRE